MPIITFPETTRRTGIPRSSLYWLASRGLFVKPVKRSTRGSGYPDYEVDELTAARIAGKTDEEIRALVLKLEAARKAAA